MHNYIGNYTLVWYFYMYINPLIFDTQWNDSDDIWSVYKVDYSNSNWSTAMSKPYRICGTGSRTKTFGCCYFGLGHVVFLFFLFFRLNDSQKCCINFLCKTNFNFHLKFNVKSIFEMSINGAQNTVVSSAKGITFHGIHKKFQLKRALRLQI